MFFFLLNLKLNLVNQFVSVRMALYAGNKNLVQNGLENSGKNYYLGKQVLTWRLVKSVFY